MTLVLTLLSIIILTFSLLAIIVITRNKKLENSQSWFKISMAVSDLLVAVLILPSIIYNMWYYVYNDNSSIIKQDHTAANLSVFKKHSLEYTKFFSIVIYSSSLVTVYSIVFAAVDRLVVVMYPLFYRSHNVKIIAKYTCVFTWILIFSVMTYNLNFRFTRSCFYYFFSFHPYTL